MKSVIIPDIRAGFDYLSSLVGSETEKERRVWVIIPDQMVLTTEREFSRRLLPSSQLYYEVVSFRRLADNIFRKYGGISYSYADGCAESLLMRRAISLCRDSLLVYGESSGSASFVPVMLSAVRELKQCMISPDMLEEASLRAEAESDDTDVAFSAGKYIDIANIWRVYDALLTESYSDRTSEMTHAAALADKRSFFRDDTVVFFSFSGFTPQQLSMIRAALKCAHETVSIFITPSVPDGGVEYDLIEDTLARLYKLSRALRVDFSREVKDIPEKNGGISELSRLLWKSSGTGGDPSALSILKCETLRGMAEAAAIKISRVIREGGRYGDFVLVTGNVEAARPAVEEIFGEYGIPCHLSYRVRLDTLPESSAILNALRVVTGGWRRDDIISYIKTGFAGIDRDEADELEIYLCTWNIHGRGFYEPIGGGWGMNPDGYREGFADGAAERLEALNKSRERVVSPLYELFDAFSDTTTVYTKTAAVREFMSAMGLSSDSFGEGESVRSQYVKIIEHALDSIEICTPDGVITSADFIGTLTMALDTLTAGTIPGREDEVELTTPVSLRGAGYKYVIMFGCGDGLPSDSEPEGLFTDSERMALEGAGLDTGSSVPKHSMELYNFSRTVSYASDEVMFLYMPTGAGDDDDDPDVITRIRRIYPDIKRGRFSGVRRAEDVFCEGVLRRRFTFMSSGSDEKAAIELLSMSPDGRRIIKSSEIPVSLPHEKISNEMARNLFGGNLSFSQSRIESFVSCKFGFYCEYVLSLKEKERARLSYSDIGTFVHAVLEAIFKEGRYNGEVSDEELDAIIEEYITSLCPREEAGSVRLRGLFHRLRRSVSEFLRAFRLEFESSDFTPVLFELPFGIKSGDPDNPSVPPIKLKLDDGTYVSLRGIADRVDTYRDDGKLWIRVIDYKTGQKRFNMHDFESGFEMQLPIYLFTLTGTDDPELKARMGGQSDDEVMPAGFLYVGVRPSDSSDTDEGENGDASVRKLPKSGLLTPNREILDAMEHGLGGNFIPVKQKRDGSFTAASAGSLSKDEGFSSIYEMMCGTVARIVHELREGEADAVPLAAHGVKSPCEYCKMKLICRSSDINAEEGETDD